VELLVVGEEGVVVGLDGVELALQRVVVLLQLLRLPPRAGVGEEGPTGFRRSAMRQRRPGASMTEAARRGNRRVLQCRGSRGARRRAEDVGERRCSARARAAAAAKHGMLQGTVAIEIADRGWKFYRVLNILR